MKTSANKNSTTTQQKPPVSSFLPKQGEGAFLPPVQTKLQVNTPGDSYEQEADAVADKVMREPMAHEPVLEKTKEPKGHEVMRACTDCAAKEEPAGEVQTVRRKMDDSAKEDGPTVMRKENGAADAATPQVAKTLSGNGQRLDRGVKNDMEQRFGRDFSDVRIHNDAQAAESAQSIQAKAYTQGNHIVFGPGEYAPESEDGKKLLAHELVHVTQQTGGSSQPSAETIQRKTNGNTQQGGGQTAGGGSAQGSGGGGQTQSPAAPGNGTPAPPPAPTPEALREPIVSEAPEDLTPAAQARLNQAEAQAEGAAEAQSTLPSDAEQTAEARGGVQEPLEETDARASGALVGLLGERPEPSPEIVELCENIRRVIRERRPPDEDSLLQADPEAAANAAGSQLNDNVQGDADRVGGEYNDLNSPASGTPAQNADPINTPDADGGGPNINAAQATPDALSEEEVSLDADVERSQQQMDDAGMTTEPAQLIETGPVADARGAQGELETAAAEDPALVLAEQDASLSNARGNLLDLQASAAQALLASRTRTVSESSGQQTAMVGDEESQRLAVATEADRIFNDAQTQVNDLLRPLTSTAMEMWNTGKTRLATEFRQHLDRVQRWVDERHSGMSGAIVEVWDDWTGMPSWVTEEYDDAERSFGDGVCELITEISTYVNGIILVCEQLIDTADSEISALYASQPAELAEWAAAEQARFAERLEGLRGQVTETRDNFNRELASSAAQAVQEVREQVHALREKAKGILGRLADSIGAFLEDPARAIIDGLLSLVGIEPAAFWALVNRISEVIDQIANDPIGFAQNLMSAIGAGFSQFFDRIGEHLLGGLLDWLFSGLGAVGVQIPQDMSLSSIVTFFLQLMGITWERIRRLLATHIGEENVQLLEQAFTLITDLIALGPAGIFEMIKDQLDPQNILDTIIQMAVEALRDALITQVAARILMLFNPVGAIAQAIEAIYRVLSWIFNNAARIFSLVETVVGGIADILAGNIGGMATAVENALARLIAPVIDFLAGYAGLGSLPERIANAVRGLQTWVEGILNRVIGWLAERARGLLQSLGLGGEEGEGGDSATDTEVGETVRFSSGGESHRLWIDSTGATPVVKMASVAGPVSSNLDTWEGRITDSSPPEARGKITQARGLLTQTTEKALETKQAMAQAQQSGQQGTADPAAQTADNQTEALQQQLSVVLGELLVIFENGQPFEPIHLQAGMTGGQETVQVELESNKPTLKVGGLPVAQQYSSIRGGPLSRGSNAAGAGFANEKFNILVGLSNDIEQINVPNNILAEGDKQTLDTKASQAKDIVGEIGNGLKIANVERLKRVDPTAVITVTPPFTPLQAPNQAFQAAYNVEFRRQLDLQKARINQVDVTIDKWVTNINVFSFNQADFNAIDESGRRAVLQQLNARANSMIPRARSNKTAYQNAQTAIQTALAGNANINQAQVEALLGRFGDETEFRSIHAASGGLSAVLQILRAKDIAWSTMLTSISRLAILHNPDQIAGGEGQIPDIPIPPTSDKTSQEWQDYVQKLLDVVGVRNINGSIGPAWNQSRVDNLYRTLTTHPVYVEKSWRIWHMNVNM